MKFIPILLILLGQTYMAILSTSLKISMIKILKREFYIWLKLLTTLKMFSFIVCRSEIKKKVTFYFFTMRFIHLLPPTYLLFF